MLRPGGCFVSFLFRQKRRSRVWLCPSGGKECALCFLFRLATPLSRPLARHSETPKGGTALLSQPLKSPPETPLSRLAFGSSECKVVPPVSQSERQRSCKC